MKCEACGKECEVIEIDEGGIEEWWGRPVWHEQLVDVSNCCKEGVVEDGEE